MLVARLGYWEKSFGNLGQSCGVLVHGFCVGVFGNIRGLELRIFVRIGTWILRGAGFLGRGVVNFFVLTHGQKTSITPRVSILHHAYPQHRGVVASSAHDPLEPLFLPCSGFFRA